MPTPAPQLDTRDAYQKSQYWLSRGKDRLLVIIKDTADLLQFLQSAYSMIQIPNCDKCPKEAVWNVKRYNYCDEHLPQQVREEMRKADEAREKEAAKKKAGATTPATNGELAGVAKMIEREQKETK